MKKNFVFLIIFSGFIFFTGCDSTDVQEEKKLKLWTDKTSYFFSDSTGIDTMIITFFNGTDSIVLCYNPLKLLDVKTDSGWKTVRIGDMGCPPPLLPGKRESFKCWEWAHPGRVDGIYSYQCNYSMDSTYHYARYVRSNEFTLKKR